MSNKIKISVLSIKQVILGGALLVALIATMVLSSHYTKEAIETASQKRLLPIYSVETSDKKVALTFDCAWGADDIPDILDILQKNDIRATFFVVGSWIDKYENMTKLIAEKGHDIGNHSDSHPHVNKLSLDENIKDMKRCNEKIKNITGKKVSLYRSPYLEYNNTVIEAAKSLSMYVIQMDVDTLDYTGLSASEMCIRIKKKIKNGSIILMHNDTKYTAKGLQQIIDTIKELGYEIIPVSELIYYDNYEINHEGRQILDSRLDISRVLY